MKLEQSIWVVCDTNGQCKGLFASQELANEAADYYGAFVSNYETIFEELPNECKSAFTPRKLEGFVIGPPRVNTLSGLEKFYQDRVDTIKRDLKEAGIDADYRDYIDAKDIRYEYEQMVDEDDLEKSEDAIPDELKKFLDKPNEW